jgi:hypothetical protein
MSDDTVPITVGTIPTRTAVWVRKTPWRRVAIGGQRYCRILLYSRWHDLLVGLLLPVVAVSIGLADATTERTLLPIEVLGPDGTIVSRSVVLQSGQAESVQSLWLQIHGLRYADQASVQINASLWTPLNNNTVTVAEPGRSYGGIGGGFSTLVMTLPVPKSTVVDGTNTIRFRFNRTDGFVSGFRVLAWNLLTNEGEKLVPADAFEEDEPKTWTPPLPDRVPLLPGESSGRLPLWWQAASRIVRGFRRTVQTVMRKMGVTSNTSTSPMKA